jgi:hypothetical protein
MEEAGIESADFSQNQLETELLSMHISPKKPGGVVEHEQEKTIHVPWLGKALGQLMDTTTPSLSPSKPVQANSYGDSLGYHFQNRIRVPWARTPFTLTLGLRRDIQEKPTESSSPGAPENERAVTMKPVVPLAKGLFFFFFCVLPVPRRKCVCDRFRFPTV